MRTMPRALQIAILGLCLGLIGARPGLAQPSTPDELLGIARGSVVIADDFDEPWTVGLEDMHAKSGPPQYALYVLGYSRDDGPPDDGGPGMVATVALISDEALPESFELEFVNGFFNGFLGNSGMDFSRVTILEGPQVGRRVQWFQLKEARGTALFSFFGAPCAIGGVIAFSELDQMTPMDLIGYAEIVRDRLAASTASWCSDVGTSGHAPTDQQLDTTRVRS